MTNKGKTIPIGNNNFERSIKEVNMERKMKHPVALIILMALLVLLGVGGIGSGAIMMIDPDGSTMQLPPELLDNSPVPTYFLPGLFLFTVMGIIPLITTYGLVKHKIWAWAASLGQGIVLVLWIIYELFLWGKPIFIQYLYFGWGVILIVLCLMPSIRKVLKAS